MIRAIACAFGISWKAASDLLYTVARSIGCEMSCLGCYATLFSELDLFEIDVRGMTVGEVSDKNRNEIVLIRIPGHLTCSRYGEIFDIWDCRNEGVDRAWIVRI